MRSLIAVPLAAAALAAGLAVADDSPPDAPRAYDVSGTAVVGVRPTGVGLPKLGIPGTTAAADYATKLTQYHDSGQYDRDLAAVDASARAAIEAQLAARSTRTCTPRYTKVKRAKGKPVLYKRNQTCTTTPGPPAKPALVLDIDDTALSNYRGMAAAGFTAPSIVVDTLSGTATAIAPTRDLYDWAKGRGVAVIFVTARPTSLESITEANLRAQGFDGWAKLYLKPSGVGTLGYKTGAREEIEKAGYTIVANVGDQESDLAGGHAQASFKLPNPFYFTAE